MPCITVAEVETVVEPVEAGAEAKGEAPVTEEEPAKPAKAKKASPEATVEAPGAGEEPAKPKRRAKAAAATYTEAEESKARLKKSKTAEDKPSKAEVEEKDATTEEGEIPEASYRTSPGYGPVRECA